MNQLRTFVTAPLAAAMLSVLFSSACGGETPPPKAPDAPAAAPSTPHPNLPPEAPDSPTASAVRISDEIVKACGISEPDAYFAFDSSAVRPSDASVLGQIVKCFTTGPLAGRTLKLVGHADPRGASDYNMTLGQSRADAVGGYLVQSGMQRPKVQSSTRGAMDAIGTDEPTWARDRRVDMLLGQ